MDCRICKNSAENEEFSVREMMFGKRDTFDYFLCSKCGCLQISAMPDDLTPYYDESIYYSHQNAASGIRGYLEAKRDRYALTGRGLIGRMMNSVFPDRALESLRSLNLDPDSRILDVGCGAGCLLDSLRASGMKNLLGADPFASGDSAGGVSIIKKPITELDGVFDVIMLHHTFEHIWNPSEALNAAHRLLEEEGRCIIRIPVMPSYAWRQYGVNWIQIDAPRHFYLHSKESMALLLEEAGFKLDRIAYDSTAFQFWGSEQYERDIPMQDERSFFVNPGKSEFSILQILNFSRKANALNKAGEGDQAVFYLTKKNTGQ